MSEKLRYIKARGIYYKPQAAGVRDTSGIFGNYPVCIIKQLSFGRWQIDYFDVSIEYHFNGGCRMGAEDKPNQRVILHPSGIEEIRYDLK